MIGSAVNPACPVNVAHPLNRGLVGWWLAAPWNTYGGSKLRDLVRGNGRRPNDGTLTNGPTWAGVRRPAGCGSLSLASASSQYVDVPSLSATPTTATFSCWAYLSGAQASFAGLVLSRGTAVTGMNMNAAGTDLGYTWNADSATYNWNSGLTITTGRWVWLCVSISPSAATAYLGDPTAGTLTSATNTTPHASTTLDALKLGYDGFGARYFNGYFDDARLYTRATTGTEAAALYNQSRRGYPDALNWVGRRSFGTTVAAAGGGYAWWARQPGAMLGSGVAG